MLPAAPRPRRSFVQLAHGAVHYAEVGAGAPVVLLHQTPRSWDEYRDVLPILGTRRRAIAMDTPGFGDSTPLLPNVESIEAWAQVLFELLDRLELTQVDLAGHHTGAAIAVAATAREPGRVRALVLSSCPFHSARSKTRSTSVDDVQPSSDGSHLVKLWQLRQPFYPEHATDLLERFVVDALRAGPRAAGGHAVVARFDVAAALSTVRCPVLLIGATADPYAYPNLARLQAALPHAETVEVEGGMVPLPDQFPRLFAETVERFLEHRP